MTCIDLTLRDSTLRTLVVVISSKLLFILQSQGYRCNRTSTRILLGSIHNTFNISFHYCICGRQHLKLFSSPNLAGAFTNLQNWHVFATTKKKVTLIHKADSFLTGQKILKSFELILLIYKLFAKICPSKWWRCYHPSNQTHHGVAYTATTVPGSLNSLFRTVWETHWTSAQLPC